ncbi:ATP-binding protein [Pseudoalteromonas fenneropenaei]|uniref:histidine kinase n=1 Tax=Pseudoalteromonas fenneropenaei TaxID=1737459 RepID=A0ABV7CHD9_9GAMM
MRSLTLNVFVWFWLTILAMLIMLVTLSSLRSEVVKTRPLPEHAIENLHHLAKNLERKAAGDPSKLNTLIRSPRFSQSRWLYLSHTDIEKSLSSQDNDLGLDFSHLYVAAESPPFVLFTERYSAHGPALVVVGTEQYQLYQIRPLREPPIYLRIRFMPLWEKALAILLPSLLFSWWFSRRLTRPIDALSRAAKRFANGDLSARVEHQSKPQYELALLSDEFNQMAQRIADNMSAQKRLLGDVSHELRSPLTRLLLACGLLESELSEAQMRHLNRIIKEGHSIEDMLQNVLMLSRLEGQNQMLDIAEASMAAVLGEVLNDAAFEAESLGKTLYQNYPQAAQLRCDMVLLASAIENILRNALKYAHQQVYFSVEQDAQQWRFVIYDDGPGVSDEVLDKLCEPFYRTSESRSRDSGGIGLGLAIAHRAILAHHGKLSLSHQHPHGLRAEIMIPL